MSAVSSSASYEVRRTFIHAPDAEHVEAELSGYASEGECSKPLRLRSKSDHDLTYYSSPSSPENSKSAHATTMDELPRLRSPSPNRRRCLSPDIFDDDSACYHAGVAAHAPACWRLADAAGLAPNLIHVSGLSNSSNSAGSTRDTSEEIASSSASQGSSPRNDGEQATKQPPSPSTQAGDSAPHSNSTSHQGTPNVVYVAVPAWGMMPAAWMMPMDQSAFANGNANNMSFNRRSEGQTSSRGNKYANSSASNTSSKGKTIRAPGVFNVPTSTANRSFNSNTTTTNNNFSANNNSSSSNSKPFGPSRTIRAAAASASVGEEEDFTGDFQDMAGGITSTFEDDGTRTTVMLRNLPNDYSREMLLALLDDEGFAGSYDFVYYPVDFHRWAGFGYAFVNMVSPAEAMRVRQVMQGFSRWEVPSQKVIDVCWGNPLQGLAACVERYRNSPVMHEAVPDKFKPVIFCSGVRMPFPPPTKRIRNPRWKRGAGDCGMWA